MKRITLILLLLLPLLAGAQDSTVHFEHTLTWEQVKAKAKAEHKYIFMDCFATWCGPCRMMSMSVFPTPEAGAFFNPHFVNVKLQFDTTKNDDAMVKTWHAIAEQVNHDYNIKVFPTFLFFDGDGRLVHRIEGASGTAADFIPQAQVALDTATQYYTQLESFRRGRRDTAFLRRTALAAFDAGDKTSATAVFNAYYTTQLLASWMQPGRLRMLATYATNSKSAAFTFMLQHGREVDSVMQWPGAANTLVMDVIMSEELFTKTKPTGPEPDWKATATRIANKYPAQEKLIRPAVANARMEFNRVKQNGPGFILAAKDFVKNYGDDMPADKLYEVTSQLYYFAQDTSTLQLGHQWIARAVSRQEDTAAVANYLYTDACLYYRLGNTPAAIATLEKAVPMADDMHRYHLSRALERVKAGISPDE